MENLTFENITLILGILVFGTTIITQVTKDFKGIKNMPTQLYTTIISFIVTISAFTCYVDYTGNKLKLYYIISVIFVSLCVSYISSYGYDSFKDIYEKCKNIK